jgi:hypothetical protein
MATLGPPRYPRPRKGEGRMKRREMILLNAFLGILILSFGYLAFRLSVNRSPINGIESDVKAATVKQIDDKPCTKKSALKIGKTTDENLVRLQNYQDICHSFVTNKMMIFTSFSGDKQEADKSAATMAKKLKTFQKAGITPIVIVEPYANDKAMSYKTYLTGTYDEGMQVYFKNLRDAGITDKMMGTWVPFPEPNTPSWNNKDTEPHDFALCVNKYLGLLKQYFPKAEGSVLLNATTYEPNDAGWENGDYISLSQYVDAIDHNLVTSFGMQGFPWVSNAQQRKRTIFKATEFIQPDLAIGAAQVLRTRDIWINTGTFASKYTDDPQKTVQLSLNERKALLASIMEIAVGIRNYQQNEYRVSINLFSEDKSDTTEATDWSYFQNAEGKEVLREFLIQANDIDMPISLFDKAKWELQ